MISELKLRERETSGSPTPGRMKLLLLIELVLRNHVLFIVVPLVAAAGTAGIIGFLPQRFTSTAYLQVDEATARAADALMSSEPVLDRVLAKIPVPGDTVEERRRQLDRERTISVARNEMAKSSKLFKLEVMDSNPIGARATNLAFIEAWLDATKPNPVKREHIEAALKRTEEEIKATSSAIARLENASHPDLTAENSLQGNPATPLVSLLSKRYQAYELQTALKNELTGLSRDAVLLGEPTLPEEPTSPKRTWAAAFAALASAVLLFAFLLIRRGRNS